MGQVSVGQVGVGAAAVNCCDWEEGTRTRSGAGARLMEWNRLFSSDISQAGGTFQRVFSTLNLWGLTQK